MNASEIRAHVEHQLASTPVFDMHTHLFHPGWGELPLWGIDELLTYHYLEAEVLRSEEIRPEQYWAMSKTEQADVIWKTLFVRNAPISDATRGVAYVMHAFGLDTNRPDLNQAREFFRAQEPEAHVRNVLKLAGVDQLVMTNDPLDAAEARYWLEGARGIPEFHAALRLDRILKGWADHWPLLQSQGYQVDQDGGGKSVNEVRRFLAEWVKRMKPLYMAVSLPYTFRYPAPGLQHKLLAEAVLPSCREHNIPMALMIGPAYQVNPAIRLAGDAVGHSDIRSVEAICREHPDNRFLVTLLSRENQHELCVAARKFANLMPFGCWWFLNNSSIVEEITRERVEMLGPSFIPQHSDARVLEQVIYKWRNSRRVIGKVLSDTYVLMQDDGLQVRQADIEHGIHRMMRGNFLYWTGLESSYDAERSRTTAR